MQRGGTWSTGMVYELRLCIMLNEGRETKLLLEIRIPDAYILHGLFKIQDW